MIRRFLTRILLLVLIAFCGYNWLQTRRLQAQVNRLNTLLAVRGKPAEALWPVPPDWRGLQAHADALWRRSHAAPHADKTDKQGTSHEKTER